MSSKSIATRSAKPVSSATARYEGKKDDATPKGEETTAGREEEASPVVSEESKELAEAVAGVEEKDGESDPKAEVEQDVGSSSTTKAAPSRSQLVSKSNETDEDAEGEPEPELEVRDTDSPTPSETVVGKDDENENENEPAQETNRVTPSSNPPPSSLSLKRKRAALDDEDNEMDTSNDFATTTTLTSSSDVPLNFQQKPPPFLRNVRRRFSSFTAFTKEFSTRVASWTTGGYFEDRSSGKASASASAPPTPAVDATAATTA